MLRLVRHGVPLESLADKGLIDPIHARLGRCIDEHAIHDIREVVPRLPVYRPRRRQILE